MAILFAVLVDLQFCGGACGVGGDLWWLFCGGRGGAVEVMALSVGGFDSSNVCSGDGLFCGGCWRRLWWCCLDNVCVLCGGAGGGVDGGGASGRRCWRRLMMMMAGAVVVVLGIDGM